MSQYYKAKRTYGLFNPASHEPFRLSRTKIDLFLNCPRCFYHDLRLGIASPPGYPFSLNNAVDILLKKEFDIHRNGKTTHPLMKAYGLKAVPFQHEKMDEWRDARTRGIRYLHEPTGFLVTGGVDDVWVNADGELHIVDYKATSKTTEVNLDADWQIGYKRQMEVYQWLFRQNGFRVSKTGYFVYCNGTTDREAFDGKLEFEIKILPYEGNTDWIEPALHDARTCLEGDSVPQSSPECDLCLYQKTVLEIETSDIQQPIQSKKVVKAVEVKQGLLL